MKLFIVVVLAILSGNYLTSQDCNSILLGEVVDFHDNTPLANATIEVNGKQLQAVTDASGKFSFKTLCNGLVEIEISHPDCKSQFVQILIDGDTYHKIRLEHHLEELEEVKVVGDASETTSSQEEQLSVETIEKYSGNSLGEALKSIAGVSSLNTGANIVKPVIQGLNGSRVLMLNNNVRMQDMEWGEEHAPNIDINSNQSISVIKGAGALEFGGDAIGGVIILNPLPIARVDSLFGKTQMNLFSNGRGGNITSTLIKSYDSGLYFKVQGSLKRLGDLEAPDYLLSNTGIRENSFSFNFGKRDFIKGWEAYYSFFDSDIGILRASHIGNVDDLINAINSPQPSIVNEFSYQLSNPKQEVTHHLVKFNYYQRFKASGKLNLQYDYQNNNRFEFDIRRGDRANIPSLDLRLQTHTFSPSFEFDAKQEFHLKFGALGRYQNNFADPSTEAKRLIPDYNKYDFGFYTIAEYELQENWTLDAGLRYDFTQVNAKKFYGTTRWEERNYDQEFQDLVIEDLGTQLLVNPIFNYHNVSATGGFKYEFGTNQMLKLNYAFAQRAPNPSELFSDGLHHSAARIELGDLRIKSEASSKVSASYELNASNWQLSLAPFLNSINDFIVIEPTGTEETNRGAFPVWTYRQTDAQLVGVDVSLLKKWSSNISSDHQFSWVRGVDKTLDEPLINIPAANINTGISYSKKAWNNFKASLESQYTFKQNRTPEDIMVFSPLQQSEVLLEINSAPPAYHLMNLDFSADFSLKKQDDFSVGLRITNLLNTNYRDYLNRLRYFVDDLGSTINLRLIYKY